MKLPIRSRARAIVESSADLRGFGGEANRRFHSGFRSVEFWHTTGMTCKTRSASLRRFIGSVYDWCRRHRHLPVAAQHKALKRRIQGHFNYFGVSGNFISLLLVIEQVKRAWYKWLCRRSQRKRLTWERFADLLRDFPLPIPRIMVSLWGT